MAPGIFHRANAIFAGNMQSSCCEYLDTPMKTLLVVIASALILGACGGGKKASSVDLPSAAAVPFDHLQGGSGGGGAGSEGQMPRRAAIPGPSNDQEAARFLVQASFGPTVASLARVRALGFSGWLDEQFTLQPRLGFQQYWRQRDAQIRSVTPNDHAHTAEINHVFWTNALSGEDQLRQRVAFALSQIFVISVQEGCGADNSEGAASYYDLLVNKAFGSYRDLLEAVSLHPVMGCYLSHLHNQKEDLTSGRVPDENFAREVMQLFSIGLVQLNLDGTPKINASTGRPVESYTPDDIAGLAKVFTGWSWDCPGWPSDNCFLWGADNLGPSSSRWTSPMRPYAKFHSKSEKRFLGVVIPPQTTANPTASLKVALDALASHPNVGPFIGKQLIQRLVTSNPSPAYVRRVANVFVSSGGSMKETVRAILEDPEARDHQMAAASATFGKVREPILMLSSFLRAYGATSDTGYSLMWESYDPVTGVAQSVLRAPSVFNFYRPGYVPPGSESAAAGLAAPEMQILNETSVAGYVNYMRTALSWGVGQHGYDNTASVPDIRVAYLRDSAHPLFAMADNPILLIEDINQRLMYGTMSTGLKNEVVSTISRLGNQSLSTQASDVRRQRLFSALLLVVAAPEFRVQK